MASFVPKVNSSRAWNSLFFAVAWTVWESRNQLVFNGKAASISLATDMVGFRVVWWFKFLGKNSADPITYMLLNIQASCAPKKARRRFVKEPWHPTFSNDMKFNVDGSSRGNPGCAGIGDALSDDSGKVIGLFSLHMGYLDAITAELLAILKACELRASSIVLRRNSITIVSDVKMAVSWVNGDDFESLEHVNIINEIRSFMVMQGIITVVHNSRISNTLADNLAKKGAGMNEDVMVWEFM